MGGIVEQFLKQLNENVESADRVLWSPHFGKQDWKIQTKGTVAGRGGRVFCITDEMHPFDDVLWDSVSKGGAGQNRRLYRLILQEHQSVPPSLQLNKSPFLQFLEKFTRKPQCLIVQNPDPKKALKGDGVFEDQQKIQLDALPAFSSCSTSLISDVELVQWLDGQPSYVDLGESEDVQQQVFAARAASDLGCIPVVSVKRTQAWIFAQAIDAGLLNRRKLILLCRGWEAVQPFNVLDSSQVLTPASMDDVLGALDFSLTLQGPLCIVLPLNGLSSRASLKSSWADESMVSVKKGGSGESGSILLIVPGTMAREAVKASEWLQKEGFSIQVISVRNPQECSFSSLAQQGRAVDLVAVSAPGAEVHRESFVSSLVAEGCDQAEAVAPGRNGKELSAAIAEVYRQRRFARTLDDVREDRWR